MADTSSMPSDKHFDTVRIEFGPDSPITTRVPGRIDHFTMITTADCFIYFNGEANRDTGHPLMVRDNNKTWDVQASTISVMGVSGRGTLYVACVRR